MSDCFFNVQQVDKCCVWSLWQLSANWRDWFGPQTYQWHLSIFHAHLSTFNRNLLTGLYGAGVWGNTNNKGPFINNYIQSWYESVWICWNTFIHTLHSCEVIQFAKRYRWPRGETNVTETANPRCAPNVCTKSLTHSSKNKYNYYYY